MDNALITAKDHLTTIGPQRVWSLLVTVFGDLAQRPGDSIDGPVLSALMQTLNIKPEALRVALHRLRKEGWIISTKNGRISHHSLTPRGRAESVAASPRIYGAPADMPQNWQIILTQNNGTAIRTSLEKLGFAPLMSRVFLGDATLVAPKGAFALPAQNAPNWLRAQFEPSEIAQDYAVLFDALKRLKSALPETQTLTSHDIAVLRCLIVHSWRRLVLRHSALPRSLYTDNWRGHDCRALVTDLLGRLPKPELADL